MKPALSFFIAASLALFLPQGAEACRITKQWTEQDIAFADVIFEGSLTDVEQVPRDESVGRSAFFKFTFDVNEVVRGELQQDEIVIGWISGNYSETLPLSLENLKNSIGETTRVGISTPHLANLYCELKVRDGDVYDERMQPVCDYTVDSLKPALRENIPFVLSNGYICGRSYLFPVQIYEDMRNHEKNVEAYKEVREAARATYRGTGKRGLDNGELYREMVPQGPLPWKYKPTAARNLAVDLVRAHPWFFTPKLRTNTDLQDILLDLGVAIGRYKNGWGVAWFDRDETAQVKFREDLKKEMLRLLGHMEKDPDFRTRLLGEDF